MAESLCLLLAQVVALEADDYHYFKGAVYYKGHLRTYARLLELDAEPLVDLYTRQVPAEESDPTAKPLSVPPIQRPARGHSFRYWGLAVALVVAVTLWQTRDNTVSVSDVTASVEVDSQVEVDSNDQHSLQTLQPDSASAPAAASGSGDYVDFDNGEEESVVIDLPAGESGPSAAETSAEPAAPSPDEDVLRFAFTEDCWVEVTDGNGEVIHAGLEHGEGTLELHGTAPFKVLLGYAHGVTIDYNGEPVQVDVENRNNSARLVVGNMPVQ